MNSLCQVLFRIEDMDNKVLPVFVRHWCIIDDSNVKQPFARERNATGVTNLHCLSRRSRSYACRCDQKDRVVSRCRTYRIVVASKPISAGAACWVEGFMVAKASIWIEGGHHTENQS